jgi:hypothetical protein
VRGTCNDSWVYNSASESFLLPHRPILYSTLATYGVKRNLEKTFFSYTKTLLLQEQNHNYTTMSTHTLSPKSSNESLQSSISAFSSPDKLAPAVAGPMVWEDLHASKYVIELSPREVQDIRAAVIKVKSMFDLPNQAHSFGANGDQSRVHRGRRSSKRLSIWGILNWHTDSCWLAKISTKARALLCSAVLMRPSSTTKKQSWLSLASAHMCVRSEQPIPMPIRR